MGRSHVGGAGAGLRPLFRPPFAPFPRVCFYIIRGAIGLVLSIRDAVVRQPVDL